VGSKASLAEDSNMAYKEKLDSLPENSHFADKQQVADVSDRMNWDDNDPEGSGLHWTSQVHCAHDKAQQHEGNAILASEHG